MFNLVVFFFLMAMAIGFAWFVVIPIAFWLVCFVIALIASVFERS